ncbi:hypothetical protein Q4543_18335 [Salipiger sp. 1_MG-2023]|uniref:hypothetical protein n=1 Tax=Salipiger sp. 1_MG-2023 TaxID=3062665 RepID=UPI0026E41290|nr:hypothetical protein [Salipiger sp. 1_MG-2023]MDO6587475.1 hypothetical protein [Salipiger sp. 1_MG-2023]
MTLVTASGLLGPQAEAGDLIHVMRRKREEALEEGIEFIDHATVSWLIIKRSKVTGDEVIALRKDRKVGRAQDADRL